MKLFLVIAIILPCVLGDRCCMPEIFSARGFATGGQQKHLGDIHIYIDFPSKQLTIETSPQTGMKGIMVDFGAGMIYKEFYFQCSKAPYNGLEGFDRCVPDNAQGNATQENWNYKLAGGLDVKIILDPEDNNCLPLFFSLSDPRAPTWQAGIIWTGLLDKYQLNGKPRGVKTYGCVDPDDLFG